MKRRKYTVEEIRRYHELCRSRAERDGLVDLPSEPHTVVENPDGAWGITDDNGYLRYGGSKERASDVLWEMQNEDSHWKGKSLRLVWVNNMDDFNQS